MNCCINNMSITIYETLHTCVDMYKHYHVIRSMIKMDYDRCCDECNVMQKAHMLTLIKMLTCFAYKSFNNIQIPWRCSPRMVMNIISVVANLNGVKLDTEFNVSSCLLTCVFKLFGFFVFVWWDSVLRRT